MNALSKIRIQYLLGMMWLLYAIYLAMFQNLLLFPEGMFELLVPGLIQILIFMTLIKLLNEKYTNVIKFVSLVCCGLEILWHFSFIINISQGLINGLFGIAPVFSTICVYVMNRIKRGAKMSVLKQLGAASLVTFVNFLIGVFAFYIFHYWI